MKISLNGIDKSGKTTLTKYVAGSLINEGYKNIRIAPKLSDYKGCTNEEYDKICVSLPKNNLVIMERKFSKRREKFMNQKNNTDWVIDRGDLTIFVNLLTHLIYDDLNFNQAHNKLCNLLKEPLKNNDDISIYLKIPIETAKSRGLDKEGRPSQMEFLERSIPVYNDFISSFPDNIYVIDANEPLDNVVENIELILDKELGD